MKTSIRKIIRMGIYVIVFFLPAVSYAEDIWSETPSLEASYHSLDSRESLIRSDNGVSAPEIWAETPDLSAISETVKPDFLEDGKVVTNIDPELYTETPDLMLVGSKRPTHAG